MLAGQSGVFLISMTRTVRSGKVGGFDNMWTSTMRAFAEVRRLGARNNLRKEGTMSSRSWPMADTIDLG